jgi:hypothetical protein
MIMSETPTSEVDEFARRGEEIYERDVLPQLGPADQGKAVAIEVETGDYEIDKSEIVAAHRLRERHPAALFWFRRVGSRHFYRFGHHRSSVSGTKKGQTNISAVIRKRHHIQEKYRLVWLDDGEVIRAVPVSADPLKALRGVGKGEGLLNRLLQDRREEEEPR